MEPISDFLKRQESSLTALTADWGDDAQRECLLWLKKFSERAFMAEAKLTAAVYLLAERAQRDPGARDILHAAVLTFEKEMFEAIDAFQALVQETMERSVYGTEVRVQ